MKLLTTDQVKRIFCLYWGQKILMRDLNSDRLQKVDAFIFMSYYEDMKLALIPIGKISEDHAKISLQLVGLSFKADEFETCSQRLYYELNTRPQYFTKELFQQLIIWGYAVPLYFDLGHPANGKTAIALDIAIDKTLITFIN